MLVIDVILFILGSLLVLAIGFCILVRWDTYRFNRMTPEQRREFNRRRESTIPISTPHP